ncbi:GAF domain-containing protein [Qingshengfaniella alkalisoli]|uniref:GAF domain-containing protein n=1 Tax=Qingshengfaniella alkalisoli TaxID=2599296 RepID=A0A5B8IZS8_9RHOB|nr:GAF domain-containing protein [Qingshengfaniella alkalisoli]QDY70451.1 GAF domain-containing protein [Qingshengfaniella alkalisoli]
MNDLATAVATSGNQPEATFKALETLVNDTIGVKLFTIMERDTDREVSWRSYSNMPDAYPVTGEKPFHYDRWTDQVVGRGEPFVANSVEEFADVFSDHEYIAALGCESVLNLPIVIDGELKGTLNCLHDAGHYTPDRVAAAQSLKLPGAIAFLMAAATRNEGEK